MKRTVFYKALFGMAGAIAVVIPGYAVAQTDWWKDAGQMSTFSRPGPSWTELQPPYFPGDEVYPELPGNVDPRYADVSGARMKADVREISAISLRSRDAGNQYWGRITGTEYDRMTTDWVEKKFREIGLKDVRSQTLPLPPQWFPTSWKVSLIADGAPIDLSTAFPYWGTPSTEATLDVVWGGLGTEADFQGRELAGKAVVIYSTPTPSALNNTLWWTDAVGRARRKGAKAVFVALGVPGNVKWHPTGLQPPPWKNVTFSLGQEDAARVREAIEQGRAKLQIKLDVETREGLTTNNVWGSLPGATDEHILVTAHTEAFFQGAVDNASGVATLLEIARHYARIPQEKRRRTITFLTTPAHHAPAPKAGMKWVRDNMHPYFEKTALVVNAEHTSQTQVYHIGRNLVPSTALSAGRWYMQGSDRLKSIITKRLRDNGVTTYSRPAAESGGELEQLRGLAPGFHVLRDILYHTETDIPEAVPAIGLVASARAYLNIIDDVNELELQDLRQNMGPLRKE